MSVDTILLWGKYLIMNIQWRKRGNIISILKLTTKPEKKYSMPVFKCKQWGLSMVHPNCWKIWWFYSHAWKFWRHQLSMGGKRGVKICRFCRHANWKLGNVDFVWEGNKGCGLTVWQSIKEPNILGRITIDWIRLQLIGQGSWQQFILWTCLLIKEKQRL